MPEIEFIVILNHVAQQNQHLIPTFSSKPYFFFSELQRTENVRVSAGSAQGCGLGLLKRVPQIRGSTTQILVISFATFCECESDNSALRIVSSVSCYRDNDQGIATP
jgi:hypothetical protein